VSQPARITHALASRASALRFESLPAHVVTVARQCVLDWLGVAMAARAEPLVQILLAEAREEAGTGPAPVIGHALRLSRPQAALVNGAAGHALDYDDSSIAMGGHATAPILPALLADAAGREVSGAQFIAAFVSGYELACRIGRMLNPSHYAAGFHPTATLGTFGAAAACAHLRGLDAGGTARALGIAGSAASGLRVNFGTMSKPLHAGMAARAGLEAAALAARGFTATESILDGANAFPATHAPQFEPEKALQDPEGGFYLPDNLFKFHAACHGTHGAIDAARGLMNEHGVGADDLRAVEVTVAPWLRSVCCIDEPRSGLEAKFSLRTVTAMALTGADTSEPGAFDGFDRPEVRRLAPLVQLEFSGEAGQSVAAQVKFVLKNGAALNASHDPALPERDLQKQQLKVESKFSALAIPALGAQRARQLKDGVAHLDRAMSVDPLLVIATPAPARHG